MPDRPRLLVLERQGQSARSLDQLPGDWDVIRATDLTQALTLLRGEHFDGVYVDAQDPTVRQWLADLSQSKGVLASLPQGVAVVDRDLRVLWANPRFEAWCGGALAGRSFYDALGSPEILGPDYSPFHTALGGRPASTRLHGRDSRYLELHVSLLPDSDGKLARLLTVARDVTVEVQQQQKLDALHQAGQELAGLSPEQLAEMSVEERVELLKTNIRRLIHDLLHYDVIEVRLLDSLTGRLEPLVQVGMTADAAGRLLLARPQGSGITGYVAATGKSYLCPDVTVDPLYVEGAAGARSSLTVPLMAHDVVLGTFNVESPHPAAFGEDDVKFAETFGRELAAALHTLELLSAEKHTTATQSVDAISREVALPVDEILTGATAVLDRYIGHDPEMAQRLRQILTSARSVKQSIQRLGEDLAPGRPASGPEGAHPRLKGMRVLVADNDERVRRCAHAILGRLGCVVETARDGQEALTLARLSTYDAVLADIRLPDLSGYEVYQGLRKTQPQARTILMTSYGYDPSHALVKARQEGLRLILYKPFRVDQLLDALERSDEGLLAGPGGTPPVQAVKA